MSDYESSKNIERQNLDKLDEMLTELEGVRSDGNNSNDNLYDEAKIAIELEHHMVHEGNLYTADVVNISGASLSIAFKTGAKKIHMIIDYTCESKAHIEYKKNGVITATTGTERSIANRNLTSENTSTLLSNKSNAYLASSKILEGATVVGGTLFKSHYHWGDKKIGKERRGRAEWILEVDTVYEFLLTSDDLDKGLHIDLNWYEI